jgi:hypothetical protein
MINSFPAYLALFEFPDHHTESPQCRTDGQDFAVEAD